MSIKSSQKLVEEATSMMGALTGGNPLLDNLMKMGMGAGAGAVPPRNQQAAEAQASNPHTGNSTRDRLRRKLEAKKRAQGGN